MASTLAKLEPVFFYHISHGPAPDARFDCKMPAACHSLVHGSVICHCIEPDLRCESLERSFNSLRRLLSCRAHGAFCMEAKSPWLIRRPLLMTDTVMGLVIILQIGWMIYMHSDHVLGIYSQRRHRLPQPLWTTLSQAYHQTPCSAVTRTY